ncbi:Cdc6/Cdc18 family protein [Halomarina rubra]|uniref:Cdc6/Cdc18 family protein n=1 Tax=Halomarina rubra TaxID=2071873 RepID=A0ABD6AS17_9EURY|nr:Cdc6/Cdc18 family protein [Halomarina rubra]
MITDPRVLEEDFVPSEIAHRHDELEKLSHAVRPVLHGQRAPASLVTGPSGAGKTCLSLFVAERAGEQVDHPFFTRVMGWESRREVLQQICRSLAPAVETTSRSAGDLERFIRDRVDRDHPHLVIIDEADQVPDDILLQVLYEMPGIGLSLVGNHRQDILADLPDRIQSRLTPYEEVQLSRYSTEQLVDILDARVNQGFVPGSVSVEQIERVARAADGNARSAIGTLAMAFSQANLHDHASIHDEDIDAALRDVDGELRERAMDRLSGHHRVLFDIVVNAGTEVAATDVYERYEARVNEPMSNRQVRRYMQKLEEYGFIESGGENRWRTYQVKE